MIGAFFGKYAFQSRTGDLQSWYVTYSSDDNGTILKMAATQITDTEKFAVYRTGEDARSVICLFNWQFVTVDHSSGWLMASSGLDQAATLYFAFSDYDLASLTMFNQDGELVMMRYTVKNPTPFLLFPNISDNAAAVQAADNAFFILQLIPITPGINSLRKTGGYKNGDFKRVDLTNVDLSGLDLSGGDFDGAILSGANFSNAALTGANFKNACLKGTIFCGANLSQADFSGCDITSAIWDKDVVASQAIFRDCNAVKVNMEGAQFDRADFTGADFDGATFKGGNLQRAVLQNANFSGTTFESADLSGIIAGKTTGSPGVNLSFAYMPDAKLTDAHLNGANLSHVQLYGSSARADNAVLEEADLSFSNFTGMDLSQVQLQGAILDEAILANCDLSGANLIPSEDGQAVSFVKANLQGANFTGAILKKVNMSNSAVALSDGVPLFTIISPDYISDLNKGIFPQGLADDFSAHGYCLSDNPTVTVINPNSTWNVSQNLPLEELGLGYSEFLLQNSQGNLKVSGKTIVINRMNDKKELEKYFVAVTATGISDDLLDEDSTCPNQATCKTNTRNHVSWTDMMTAATPPSPPKCIPDPYHWCPQTCTCQKS
ncbi:MAG TPA: pentapeptide repeat-containing protein [Methylomusa anaerophila]|uniref:Secreted effector protein pipB2 n=1 Tax=Methylomusa anaerophila TaxID=1930071 RepID=A0A348ANC7_9FIRM|nr:pentapeptide repeat-containing protein [Methylomusa anaerophila]BBB92575.1 secreted effector protein pipB2 [Methylomusa anaerophila]HML87571.1 pentapeptide repeat-containing protein [Methylomusa anaerophila]